MSTIPAIGIRAGTSIDGFEPVRVRVDRYATGSFERR